MTSRTTPKTPRKVNKTPTKIIPEVKLQEPRNHKKYERNNGVFGAGAGVRILMVLGLVIGAFYIGLRMGFGDFEDSLKGLMQRTPVDPMVENCQLMPEMPGCEKYLSGTTVSTTHDMMDMSMHDMGKMLEGKTGDELDRGFLEAMIPHHEGAIEMAHYLTKSNRAELRKLGEDIIKAQTEEIEQMKKWQIEWDISSLLLH